MRFLSTLANDIRYQIKYGFYLLYLIISAVYTAVLLLCPLEFRRQAASLIILTDPAMLGAFFIGGIWLLEKGEGLHGFWKVSPLRAAEYIFSKAVSLSLISTLAAAAIAFAGLGAEVNYFLLIGGTFAGAMFFTLIGLLLASYARSVNHYMLVATLPLTVLLTPAILAAFGISVPLFNFTPGVALWKLISGSVGLSPLSPGGITGVAENAAGNVTGGGPLITGAFAVIIIWFAVTAFCAGKRIPAAMNEGVGS